MILHEILGESGAAGEAGLCLHYLDGLVGRTQQVGGMTDTESVDVLIEGGVIIGEPLTEIGAVDAESKGKVGEGEVRVAEEQRRLTTTAEDSGDVDVAVVIMYRRVCLAFTLHRLNLSIWQRHKMLGDINHDADGGEVDQYVGDVPERIVVCHTHGEDYDGDAGDRPERVHSVYHLLTDIAVVVSQIVDEETVEVDAICDDGYCLDQHHDVIGFQQPLLWLERIPCIDGERKGEKGWLQLSLAYALLQIVHIAP